MPRRRLATTVVLAAGSAAGAALWRRRSGRRKERVDLYFPDGSMISVAEGSPQAGLLLPIARRALVQARGA